MGRTPQPAKPNQIPTMTINHISDIKSAIARSISHDEIVECTLDSDITQREALEYIDNDESVENLDWTSDAEDMSPRQSGKYTDVWGTYQGGEFRLHIFSA
jgi:hypothetical protein